MRIRFRSGTLRRDPQIAFYFRYPLRQRDFHKLYENGRVLGRYAAKPLYGRLTNEGKVDRSAGFNGQVAIIFIPTLARRAAAVRLLFTEMPPGDVTLANGHRNWLAIRRAAKRAIRRAIARAR